MPGVNIPDLTATITLDGTELIEIYQSGVNKQGALSLVKTYISAQTLAQILSNGSTTGSNDITFANQTASRVPILDGTKKLVSSSTTTTQLAFLNNVTSDIQAQFDILTTSWKLSCKASTTGNQTLSGLSNVDGVSISSGDRILVQFQTAPSQNGIYYAASGAWTRAKDFGSGSTIASAVTLVEQGTIYKDQAFSVSSDNPIVVGSSDIVWVPFGGIYSKSTTPAISLSTGAGTGASATIAGNNETGLITLTTGTTPAHPANIFTLTFSGGFTFPNGSTLIINANDDTTAANLSAAVVSSSGTTTTVTFRSGIVSLAASTVYKFNYLIKGY